MKGMLPRPYYAWVKTNTGPHRKSVIRFSIKSLIGAVALGLVPAVMAQASPPLANPFLGRNQFPQYRQISGLSGGGYGISYDGSGSLSGATAFSTPLGYTLGKGQFRLGLNDTFFRMDNIAFRFKNDVDATGKAFFSYGHSFGNFAVTYSYFVKSYEGDASTNIQFAFVPKSENDPGFSVGVQDIVGHGGAAGEGQPGDGDSSRSFFAAATYGFQVAALPNTLYVTAGVGTRRFGKGFASSSYQLGGPLRLWAEYDGFGVNEGVLVSLARSAEEGERSREVNLLVGLIKSRYLTLGLTVGF